MASGLVGVTRLWRMSGRIGRDMDFFSPIRPPLSPHYGGSYICNRLAWLEVPHTQGRNLAFRPQRSANSTMLAIRSLNASGQTVHSSQPSNVYPDRMRKNRNLSTPWSLPGLLHAIQMVRSIHLQSPDSIIGSGPH